PGISFPLVSGEALSHPLRLSAQASPQKLRERASPETAFHSRSWSLAVGDDLLDYQIDSHYLPA
ncbi:MAG: hypothetical protein IKX53_01610, partial [Bacteroidales bacterium]|nr:hypothetical protein [Bacteroidales bacterium]